MKTDFHLALEECFHTVAAEYSFRMSAFTKNSATFDNGDIVLSLGYDDQRSFEVYLTMARRRDTRHPSFTFEEILRSAGADISSLPYGYCASSQTEALRLINTMIKLLCEYARGLLNSEETAWLAIFEQRRKDSEAYFLTKNLDSARHHADAAWKKRDYVSFVSHLEPLRHALTDTEARKLDYAIRHVPKREC
jgi:hypothetical protein